MTLERNKTERPDKLDRSTREDRVPIHGDRDRLSIEGQEEGFHYCWVNDYNVPKFERAGYEFVEHPVIIGDRRVDAASSTGVKHSLAVGNGVTAYLMRCPNEYFDQDMAALNEKIDSSEAAMYAELNSRKDGSYGKVEMTIGSRNKTK